MNGAKIGGQTCTSPETVLAGAQQTAATAIAALPREPDPIVGKALIVIADRDRLHVLPAMSRLPA